MDSIAYAYAAMTVVPAQARTAAPTLVQHAPMLEQHSQASNGPIDIADASSSVRLLPVMAANAAARIKGQVSPTPVYTFAGVWSPPPRREPL